MSVTHLTPDEAYAHGYNQASEDAYALHAELVEALEEIIVSLHETSNPAAAIRIARTVLAKVKA